MSDNWSSNLSRKWSQTEERSEGFACDEGPIDAVIKLGGNSERGSDSEVLLWGWKWK